MVNSDASTTVLIAVIGTAVVVCIIYFCHTYLRPHLKKPQDRVDSPLPQWQPSQVRSDPRLQTSLYASAAPDHLHPRHSRADTEMRRTRWSTNVYDLSRPSSRVTGRKHVREISLLCNLPPAPSLIDLKLPASSNGSMTSQRTPNGTLKRNTLSDLSCLSKHSQGTARMPKRNTLTMSDLLAMSGNPTPPRTRTSQRHRSRSDSSVATRRSLILAESHAALTGENGVYDPRGQATARLSEASLPLINNRKSLTRYSSYASFAQAAMDANSSKPSSRRSSRPSSQSGDTMMTALPPLSSHPEHGV